MDSTLEQKNRQQIFAEYSRREAQSFHEKADDEQVFYTAVRRGDVALVKALLQTHCLSEKKALGRLSASPLQDMKYHFVITAALVARHCIEGGMLREEAFLLSDQYIYEVDQLLDKSRIDQLLNKMLIDYTERMRQCQIKGETSREVNLAVDYIYKHLHERITVEEVAKAIGYERSYLSRLFKQQMGEGMASYILNKKLETARNMLLYAKYDILMITQLLSFSSQSSFTAAFKKKYGLTPKRYRDQHHQKVYG